MKHIIKISELIGTEIHTRFSLDSLKEQLNASDEYLIDMEGVGMISRSAADELYTMAKEYKLSLVHLSNFVQLMMDTVAIGRFTPRIRNMEDVKFIKCETFESLETELQKLGLSCPEIS